MFEDLGVELDWFSLSRTLVVRRSTMAQTMVYAVRTSESFDGSTNGSVVEDEAKTASLHSISSVKF